MKHQAIQATKVMPPQYRITYDVQRPWGWEGRHVDQDDRSEAEEIFATLESLQHSPDVQPQLRNVKKNW